MATLKPGSKNSVRPRGRRRIRPSLLVLENRTLLSTLVVTNLQDSGNGSLRYELSQANNNDTITFQSTLFAAGQQTITLTSGPLAVSKDVSIQGPGASLLTVSGNSTQEIFKVSSPGSPSQGSTISGMTITRGFNSTNGGAIYNSGTLALSGCTISGSKAGTFQAYYSANGGAIYNKGTLSLSGCTVSGNYSSGNGGAIDSEGGALSLSNCTVSGNTSSGPDGGIRDVKSTLSLTGTSITGNTSSYGTVGGIYFSFAGGTATLLDCTVSGNKSPQHPCGGIYNHSGGTITLTDCTISQNDATAGGGILNNGGTVILASCTVAGNAAATGAGISSSGSGAKLTLTNCIVSTNLAVLSGGGISNSGSLTLTYCTVSGNRAVKGAGIYNSDFSLKGSLAMSDCTISGNTATSSGGGIYNLAALSLTNCTVYGNDAFATNPGYGGGIFNNTKNYPAITPTVTNCTITGNAAGLSGGTGGNILNIPGSNFTLNNSIVAYSLNTGRDIAGVVSGNNNIVDDSGAAGGLSFANGNLFEAPGLTKLGYYGGPTETMVPAQGSPAIDNGDNALIPAGVTTDQRGRRASTAWPWTSAPSRADGSTLLSRPSPTRTTGQSTRRSGPAQRSARRSISPTPTPIRITQLASPLVWRGRSRFRWARCRRSARTCSRLTARAPTC